MVADHLQYSGQSDAIQHEVLCRIVRDSPILTRTLAVARDLGLPDWWLVSGAIYNQVWNRLTGRPDMYGVKDIDLFYFDPDTSYDAEDRHIRNAQKKFPVTPPVELRNQARVHLWFSERFGIPYDPLSSAREGIDRFACRTHCVGIRLEADEGLTIYSPYGLDDIFAFRLTPNALLDNRATHEAKAVRQMALWPELRFVPWPEPGKPSE
jgi:uncharacterized protein